MTSMYITINLPHQYEMDDSWKEVKEFIEKMDDELRKIFDRTFVAGWTNASQGIVINDLYPGDADKLEIMFNMLAFAVGDDKVLSIRREDEYFCEKCGHWLLSMNNADSYIVRAEGKRTLHKTFDHYCPECLKLSYVG